jgi:S-DNA-T family DNA segregation ATPase FtsK/SpoIIIE
MQGLNAGKAEDLDVLGRWSKSRPFDSLAAPIGIRENGEVFHFDISDKAMGAHGLVGAMAGWGKTKLLNTYILSVALNFSPIEVNFVLVDFKGTDLGRGLTSLPHIAGQISNINDIGMIDRNLRSLKGELVRRQKLFAKTGIENIHKYQEAVRSGRVSEPLPYLLFIVDEFAEMKTKFPDKMEDIIQIARIGRSLGVYMTLATQSPDSSIISGQVESNTHFRICLKTAGAEQSKAMLGTSDAFGITTKGRAIVKVGDNEVYEQVQTFYIDADYLPEKSGKSSGASKIYIVETNGERSKPEVYDKSVGVLSTPFTEGIAVANYIKSISERSAIPKARQVWTDALPETLSLDTLIRGREAFAEDAWSVKNSGFAVIAGFVDDPDNQTQYPLTLDFAADGHIAVYGAPSSGKTTFLQTAIISVAYTYTPEQAEFVMFDYGNYALRTFETLPHTRVVVNSGDSDKVKQAEEYILAELERRKRLFAVQGAGTIETYRNLTGNALPYLLIIADNMSALAGQSPDLADSLNVVARDGGSLGLYLLLTAGNQGSFMYRIAQNIKVSVALQMTDKSDYRQLVGGNGKQEPSKLPGRGFVKGPLEFQTALFADGSESERVVKLREVCAAMRAAWKGGTTTVSASTPAALPPIGFDTETTMLNFNRDMVEIGVDRATFAPFAFDFREMSGCVISGAAKSGKTNLLSHIAVPLSKDDDTRVYIFEKGSELSSLCPSAKTAHSGAEFDGFAREIAEEYDKRTENEADTPRIAIIIDGFKEFFSEIADETVDLLDPIVNYGEEYGIYVYIADNRDELTKLRFGASPLSNALSFGRGIALGGKLKEHAAFDGLYKSDDIPLATNEAAVIRGGKVSRVKIAQHTEVSNNA